MAAELYAGTSGFSYPEWRGAFYPVDLPDDAMLAHYSRHLRTVEMNNTFYRFPRLEHVAAWRDATPPGFRFSVKANRRITHIQRLRDVAELVRVQLERVAEFRDRLGPVLFQLPASLRADPRLLASFLTGLPPMLAAVEFRHASWYTDEVYGLLGQQRVALAIMESGEDEPVLDFIGPFVYLRLHRTVYSHDEIAAWAAAIRGQLEAGKDVYAYFTHEEGSPGPAYALALRRLVSAG